MRETKDQTIGRLEKTIGELKAELTAVKKDRKRLNYAVEALENKIDKLSNQSSKEDAVKMKELEKQTLSTQSRLEYIARQNRELAVENEELKQYRQRIEERMQRIRIESKERHWRWQCFLMGYPTDKWGQLFFDIDTLITRINPLNGCYTDEKYKDKIREQLKNDPQYKEALERIEPLKQRIREEEGEAIKIFYSESILS